MPLDGIVTKNLVCELNKNADGGRIDKIHQPGREEVIITLRAKGKNLKILVTSNAAFPRIHFTEAKNENPQTPPMFCMSLRKHLAGGKICEFFQPSLERIVEMRVESPDEMGDLSIKRLILEIMGKHSNIILVNEYGKILDCAKKIGFDKSSVREVLPGKQYEYPPGQNKLNPLEINATQFYDVLNNNKGEKISDAIFKNYCGISPFMAVEICERAGINEGDYVGYLNRSTYDTVFESFRGLMDDCANGRFAPEIVYEGKNIIEFSSITLSQFCSHNKVRYSEISKLLETYYGDKAKAGRLKQKTLDLRKLIENNIKRCAKKRDVLDKTLNDTENMDEWRICGELITSYISLIPEGADFYDAQDYYNENSIKKIKLSENLTPAQNAARYFEKYNKAKRQKKAVTEQLSQNEEELKYFEGLYNIVLSEITENEIMEIREELFEEGYLKKKPIKKGVKLKKSRPLHYVSSDGYYIYVGKNNKQNDELTLKFAQSNDIWLHAKEIPGSHVIIKTEGKPPSDTALNEAALLAAFHSKARDGSQVPVDYARKKYVKKPNGSKPGMVIYENYKTAYVTPEIEKINLIKELKELKEL